MVKSWYKSPYFSLIIGLFFVSLSAIFVKLAAVSGLTSAFYRMTIALVVLGSYYIPTQFRLETLRKSGWALVAGMVFGIDIAFWNVGIQISDATVGTLLNHLSPIWVGMFTWIFLRKKLTTRYWLGLAVCVVGMVILLDYEKLLFHFELKLGYIFAIIASFAYASYLMIVSKSRNQLGSLDVMFYTLIGTMLPIGVGVLVGNAPLTGFSWQSWGYMAGLGIAVQLGGWITINASLKYIAPSEVSVWLLGQAVFTALLAVWILGETMNIMQIFGGMIVLIGIYLACKVNKN
jgi:drug/metabolite transporter (DMT)-like permease